MELSEIKVSYLPMDISKMSYNNSEFIYRLVLDTWDKSTINLHEELKVILLNRANKLLGVYHHSKGGVSGTYVDLKLILSVALKCVASHIILVHNHPSGNLTPSQADIEMTRKLKRATKQVDLVLLDHLIITNDAYYSFADKGQL